MQDEKDGGIEQVANKAMDMVGGLAGKAKASLTSSAPEFARSASISDKYEIEAGQIALDRADTPAIREVAQKMIDDHTNSSRKLEAAVGESEKASMSDLSPTLDTRRTKMIEHLREAPAAEFEKMYVTQQKLAHEEAVTLMNHYKDEGDCPVLRGFARETAPIIEGHLQRIEQLDPQMTG